VISFCKLKIRLLTTIFLFNWTAARAQTECIWFLNGEIHDGETDEPLQFVQVILINNQQLTTLTNVYGYYEFWNLCPGEYLLEVELMGYKKIQKKIFIKNNVHEDFHLHHESCELPSVSIIHERPSTYIQELVLLEKEELSEQKGKTLGEILQNLPGIQAVKSGPTLFKPIIHGFYGNRIMILQNGLRIEGQQWGNDHAPEIDPDQAEKIEVIKGASALRYGNEAMGGVILISSEKPKTTSGFNGEVSSGFFSNGKGGLGSLSFNGAPKWIKGLGVGLKTGLKKHGNIKTPSYFLNNTGYEEMNYSVTFLLHKRKYQVFAEHTSYNSKIGIFEGSHIGNMVDLVAALQRSQPITQDRFTYKINRSYQKVNHNVYKVNINGTNGTWGRPGAMVALQHNLRKEFDVHRPKSSNITDPTISYDLMTLNGEFFFEHKPYNQLTGVVGYSFMNQSNISNTSEIRLFIPNFYSMNHGFFWIENFRLKRFLVEAGIRQEVRKYQIFKYINENKVSPQKIFFAPAFSAGFSYFINEHWQIKNHFSYVQRVPAINEMFSDGLHHAEGIFIVADTTFFHFKNEKLMNTVFLVDYSTNKKSKFTFNTSIFLMQNFINLKPIGVVSGIRGAYPAFKYVQYNSLFWVFEANYSNKISNKLNANFYGTYIYAKYLEKNDYFIGIPPSKLYLRLNYVVKENEYKKTSCYTTATYTFKQNYFPREIIEINYRDVSGPKTVHVVGDFLPPPNGYMLLEAGMFFSFQIKKQNLGVFISVENFTQTKYRDYLNRLRYYADEKGLNIRLRMVLTF